jgi:nucleotide-binding universal stress UspA family protein
MKILVNYDGSNIAKEVLKLAQKHSRFLDAKLEVVNTITRSHPLNYSVIEKAEEELKRQVWDILNGDNTNYETHLMVSDMSSGEQVVKFAEENDINEIILGVKRNSKVRRLFGTDAQYVILNAPCPVITIK